MVEASKIGFVEPADFTVQLSILILVLVIFGGMGSLPGAVIGAAVLQFIPQYLRVHPLLGFQQQDLYHRRIDCNGLSLGHDYCSRRLPFAISNFAGMPIV